MVWGNIKVMFYDFILDVINKKNIKDIGFEYKK